MLNVGMPMELAENKPPNKQPVMLRRLPEDHKQQVRTTTINMINKNTSRKLLRKSLAVALIATTCTSSTGATVVCAGASAGT